MNKILKTAIMSVSVCALYIINTLLISPALQNAVMSPDISNAHIIEILLYLSGLFPVIATFLGYAFIINEVCDSSVKGALPYMIAYQICCLVMLALTMLFDYVKAGSLPASDELFYNALSLVLNLVLIAVMMYAVVFATHKIKQKKLADPLTACAFAAALLEGIKQLAIELFYILPFLLEYITDISANEVLSVFISLLWPVTVFGVGYAVIVGVSKLLNIKKKAA